MESGIEAMNGKTVVKSISLKKMSLSEMASHISSHGSPYTRDVVYGVLLAFMDCAKEQMAEGKRVELGDIGTLRYVVKAKAQADESKATIGSIKSVRVAFTPSLNMQEEKSKLEYKWVAELQGKSKHSSTTGGDGSDGGSTGSDGGSTGGDGGSTGDDGGEYNEKDGID